MYNGSPLRGGGGGMQWRRAGRNLREVAVDLLRRIRVVRTLEVLAGDEIFDALLDHGDVGLEATGQDSDNLRYKLVVRKLFAGPVGILLAPRA